TLLGASVVSVAIMIERAKTLKRLRVETDALMPSLRERLRRKLLGEVRDLVQRSETPLAALLKTGLENVNGHAAFRKDAIAKELAFQQQRLARRLGILATIASNAPYVGLFGTVCGIMKAFTFIAEQQGMSAGIIAKGISEALMTTALGLFVAIPAGVAYNHFVGRVNYFIVDLDRQMADFEPLIAEEPVISKQ
ncbi:MAG: MotA/TolQ/ExbB proton channel family protein, partial [Abditibacteriales bacterium]|nr:MotA/TolQ/ExbB proton channel family protein [Abditibacteriales bacterium]MDW8366586.1 MotA/TolQ/ExbB proton channel family protein [Abditibacteriales bacterium]